MTDFEADDLGLNDRGVDKSVDNLSLKRREDFEDRSEDARKVTPESENDKTKRYKIK